MSEPAEGTERLLGLRDQAREREEQARDKQHERGRQTARERIDKLLDPGSFAEIDRYRREAIGPNPAPRPVGDAVVTGHGTVDGRPVAVYSQDFTVLGGSVSLSVGQKVAKVMDLAAKSGMPIIGINDSGGARIQDGLVAITGYGEIFRRNVMLSGVVPQLSLMMGPCAGGAAYSPAMTDFVVMVRQSSYMFVTGPEVIRAVTGERVDPETLGGADTHATRSGVAHLAVDSEQECIEDARALLGFLPSHHRALPPDAPPGQAPADHREVGRFVPDDPSRGYDMRGIIRALVDDGDFLEIQPEWATTMICGFARLEGMAVGIYGNQPMVRAGVIDIDASEKAARFIRTCNAYNVPLLCFADVPGYLPGVEQEWGGIIRHGAKLIFAITEATVPKLTVNTRKAYGGAYGVMGCKQLLADINLAWPQAELAVMGAEGAVSVLGRKELKEAADPEAKRAELLDRYRRELLTPYPAAERGYVDDVIDPADTRDKLIASLHMLRPKHQAVADRKHSNIPL
jgi:acetyl-CoA carboxylase carboxyltransferase component